MKESLEGQRVSHYVYNQGISQSGPSQKRVQHFSFVSTSLLNYRKTFPKHRILDVFQVLLIKPFRYSVIEYFPLKLGVTYTEPKVNSFGTLSITSSNYHDICLIGGVPRFSELAYGTFCMWLRTCQICCPNVTIDSSFPGFSSKNTPTRELSVKWRMLISTY